MAKIQNGEALDLIVLSKAEAKVGDYKYSHLIESDFSAEHLGQWMLCDGRSCVGTTFESITGATTVPNALTEGTFIRQAKAGRGIGSYEADAFKSHSHAINAGGPNGFGQAGGGAFYGGTSTSATGGTETRPKNIALNLYVKVGY